MTRYVIIGNGTAQVGCIDGIRKNDKNGEITVITEEKFHVYARPLISYYLEGKTDTERMKYRDRDYYKRNACRVLYGKRAEKIDIKGKEVILSDGEKIKYDKLLNATGSTPFVPPFEGMEKIKRKFGFMSLSDALSLEKELDKKKNVLIVGAGLIGLKCAEGIRDRVGKITVCDLAPRILSSILDEECAGMVQRHLEAEGIEILTGDTVTRFEKNRALMKSGREIPFDTVVFAVGVRPNISLIKDAGGECDKGIVTDDHMRTSLDDIYAAGDCAKSYDITSGDSKVIAVLPNAYMQGFCAGENMSGRDNVFCKAFAVNSMGLFGMHIMTAGTYYTKDTGGELYEDKTEQKVKKLFVKDGVLKGFILINCIEKAGIYTNLIREQIPLGSVNFDIIKKDPSLAAFGKDYCCKKLGGVV